MKITERQYRERWGHFEGPLAYLAQNHPVIHRIVEEYAYGNIVTKEEALSQMVVALATNWESEQRRYFEMMQLAHPPIIAKPQ